MNKEEAIKRLNLHKDFAQVNNGCCIVNVKDIETVLSELEELQDDLKIHEETSFEFQKENINLRKKLENSIQKQVILDKIEELKNKEYTCNAIWEFQREASIDVLQEILEKGEKNE